MPRDNLCAQVGIDESATRLELSRKANFEIFKLAEAAANVCQDDDRPIFHGIMARIKTLSEVIYYAQRLHGKDEGDEPDLDALKRAFSGMLS
ncbi:hypothetical protein [Rhodoferax sp. GW822-FHT02A01]|uniref:hypothetical protein n=1 Tax=Rhodoferax sp. GW822-FHT02A01 TaxID=3141537 RepID=UPI00315CBBC9